MVPVAVVSGGISEHKQKSRSGRRPSECEGRSIHECHTHVSDAIAGAVPTCHLFEWLMADSSESDYFRERDFPLDRNTPANDGHRNHC